MSNFSILNEEDGASVSSFYQFILAFNKLQERIGVGFECYVHLQKDHMVAWLNEEYFTAARIAFNKMISDASFFPLVKKTLVGLSDDLTSFSKKVAERDLTKVSTAELYSLVDVQCEKLSVMLSWAMLVTIIDFQSELVSKKLHETLSAHEAELKKKGFSVPEALVILTTPDEETTAKKEFDELISLACEFGNAVPYACIREHAKKYGWLYYGYSGPAWTEKEFTSELLALVEKNPVQLRQDSLEQARELSAHKQELEVLFSEEEKRVIDLAREVMFLKAYRKEAMNYSFFALGFVQEELAKRLGLSLRQIRCLIPLELISGKFSKELLDSRFEECVFGLYGKEKDWNLVFFKSEETSEAKKIFAQEKIEEASELNGSCACPGFVKGIVKIINRPEDLSKMNEGDVLVSIATTPDLVPAMRKASAIVTDIGGLTCHAAIVSREMRKPCVVGTKVATKIFKDGDLIEVDASKGLVKKL
ncbi:MAG: PEP-utilizing enzyme [Candidatus Micrarchaeota archaeon]